MPTRSWPGQPEAGLDHIYSNKPEKLSEVFAEYAGGSDHKLIRVIRYAKSIKRNVRYVSKRSFKNFDSSEFQALSDRFLGGRCTVVRILRLLLNY